MNILQISANDTVVGGAGSIAIKIKSELDKKSIENSYFCGIKTSTNPRIIEIPKRKIDRIKSIIFADDMNYFKTDFILETEQYKKADIIHCHNLHGWYFNLNTLKKICSEKKVVWTFHDMWPVTAHCCHSFDCGLKDGFYGCPNLKIYPSLLWHNEKKLINTKKNIYNNSLFDIVSPSEWLAEKVKKSILKDKPLTLINNGIDTNFFSPEDIDITRKKLQLPLNKKIILFIANGGLSNTLKGGKFFIDISKKFKKNKDVVFVCIGGKKQGKSDNILFFKTTNKPEMIRDFLRASNLILFPSLAENFPLVILESISCGLPVVSFDVGGVKEIFENKKGGYIAKYCQIDDLINGINFILGKDKEEINNMSHYLRQIAIEKFNDIDMVSKYINLYNSLTNQTK
jgi:glycosyltransferase involved in cell wall biosynthesis